MRWLVWVAIVMAMELRSVGAPLLDEPTELTLTDGRVLHAAVAKSFSATAVMIRHADGAESVSYEQFPQPFRDALETRRPAKKSAAEINAANEKAAAAREKERQAVQKRLEEQKASNAARIEAHRKEKGSKSETVDDVRERVRRCVLRHFGPDALVTKISASEGWQNTWNVEGIYGNTHFEAIYTEPDDVGRLEIKKRWVE